MEIGEGTFSTYCILHCKKRLAAFPSPAGHLQNSPWPWIIKLCPARESLESDIPAGDGKIANLFLQCSNLKNCESMKEPTTAFSQLFQNYFKSTVYDIFLL